MTRTPSGVVPVHATGTGPTAEFDWTMPDRFGFDNNGDGVIDYDYSTGYIHPSAWTVNFDGCLSSAGGSPIVQYSWDLAGLATVIGTTCQILHPQAVFPAQGTYSVTLTVTAQDGQTASVTHNVVIRDLLIVSIGDSLAAGEGDPDKPQRFDDFGQVKTGPVWEDRKCHRSANAGPAQAALAIERSDPKSSVTFIHLACSGAGIQQGLVDYYEGIEPDNVLLRPQVFQAAELVCPTTIDAATTETCPSPRNIDYLLISIGLNDLGFSNIVKACVEIFGCDTSNTVNNEVQSGLSALENGYALLNQKLSEKLKVSQTFITEYPDPTTDEQGQYCTNILGGISSEEAAWASQNLVAPLNNDIRLAAQRYGWHFVGNVASRFIGHGYCAGDQRWIRTEEDSRNIQGPFCCPQDNTGTLHPNISGQAVYEKRLVQEMDRIVLPTITISPSPPVIVEATSKFGATVNYRITVGDNIGGPNSATCDQTTGAVFPLGYTSVRCTAMEDYVTTSVQSWGGSCVFTSTEDVNGNVHTTRTCDQGLTCATVNGQIVCAPEVGINNFSCDAPSNFTTKTGQSATRIDCHGQQQVCDPSCDQTTVSFTVIVQDTTPPIVVTPSDITVEATGPNGAQVTFPDATATDSVDGPLPAPCSPTTGSTFPLGTTTITCTAKDSHGNTASAIFHITVRDTTPPDTMIVSAVDSSGAALSQGSFTLFQPTTFTLAGTDLVGVAGFECSLDASAFSSCPNPSSFTGLSYATHTLMVRAYDTSGNRDPTPASFTWTIITTGQAVQMLGGDVQNMPVSQGTMSSLIGTLSRATRVLNDGDPTNDMEACIPLHNFISLVTLYLSQGKLTTGEASQLLLLANNIRLAIGCK